MNELLTPISTHEFENRVTIRFKNILDGFDKFKNFTIETTDIKNGDNLFKIVVYNQKIFRFYVSAYPNLFQNKDLFLNSNISLTP